MSLSLFVRNTWLCCFILAIPAIALAQSNFRTNSGEYRISGALPGDQIHPQVSINSSGGFLVWDDNNTDGDGQGISAAALDSNFNRVQSPFRVNQTRTSDQEHPQVALLNDGRAVFVWQGGTRSHQHIFARFLSPTNSWATGDLTVNTYGRSFQNNPVVTALTNGNALIAWCSFNQIADNSFLDVYAQIMSPNGQKIGGEFLVNQFASYNQRTPAIATLRDGRFVLAWVSEQQRQEDSVDIYARIFNQDATPATDEFIVNTSASNVCANPSIAATSAGGFTVVWGEKDHFTRESGWDVFARSFSSAGAGAEVQRLNTYIYGDQFAPRISALDTTSLVVWTSRGQDGSREGVYGRFLDAYGQISGPEFRVNTTTVGSQIHPAVSSENSERFVVTWTTFAGFHSGFDLYAQHYAPDGFVPGQSFIQYYPPTPQDPTNTVPPPGSTNGVPTNSIFAVPTLDFPVTPSIGATVTVAQVAGAYSGLFYEPDGVAAASSGYFSAKTAARGTFTAKLLLGGRTWAFAGQFDSSGNASNTIRRGPLTSLTVHLQLDLSGQDQIRGQVTDGHWTTALQADRLVFSKSQNPTTIPGTYTLIFPGNTVDNSCPRGNGFATVKLDAGGGIQLSGTLADGTKITQSSTLSKQGIWPLYVSLNGGSGMVVSWIQFSASKDLEGHLIWLKPPSIAARTYPRGFTNEVSAMGAVYQAPTAGTRVLNMSQGVLILNGGGLQGPETNAITLGMNNRVTTMPGSKLSVNITASSGLFKGSFLNPETRRTTTFQGMILKQSNVGVGYFLDAGLSGEVYLSPAP